METKTTCLIEVSIGELFDKISILEIKNEKITKASKLKNIQTELGLLKEVAKEFNANPKIKPLYSDLKKTNMVLWDIEDKLRVLEKEKDFGSKFTELARGVYYTNDKRFEIKTEINKLFNCLVVEEKHYVKY